MLRNLTSTNNKLQVAMRILHPAIIQRQMYKQEDDPLRRKAQKQLLKFRRLR